MPLVSMRQLLDHAADNGYGIPAFNVVGLPDKAVSEARERVRAALVASGLEAERFTFFGFLARKGPERRSAIDEIVALRHAAVLYEAPARVGATLAELADAGAGGREAVVARELTKQYEELRRGTVAQLVAYYQQTPPRGEVVIVIAGMVPTGASEDQLRARASALRAEGRSARDIAAALSAELGAPRNLAYRLAHE